MSLTKAYYINDYFNYNNINLITSLTIVSPYNWRAGPYYKRPRDKGVTYARTLN